ncbi:methyltransferase domain-containing protein [Falsochrobactrum sp. TDYN1]|uniref:Methyltransferase domain-containing protein n=1 Tax=Falsochrobactrum tianjinense TaxID=2706015 RepID=A0A949PKP4_9HYPH|nr:methyltransferase domain-containing protein [Falsochrobactrum sp. TDYN1]MBV2142748.1 methyltransferase domain-containing protein [Falsochrobactrum sp. TDYN1]
MVTNRVDEITETNRLAWNAQRFDAWVSAFGTPEDEAAKIIAEPKHILRRLYPYLGDVTGKRICNVQGSHGRVAVALARLGAEVWVIDFSEENRRFALRLAEAAGVVIDYALCDTMEAGKLGQNHSFDVLVLELGILHYHQNIERFFTVMRQLTANGGMLVLNEFHPVQRKLFWAEGPHDYFQTGLIEADVPNPDATSVSLGKCLYRFWTMGDIMTAAIQAGFTIVRLDEHPDWTDVSIPGTFTLVAYA